MSLEWTHPPTLHVRSVRRAPAPSSRAEPAGEACARVGAALPVSQKGCVSCGCCGTVCPFYPPPAPLGLHPFGKYSAHVSSSLCPTSARHPGPKLPPPPSSSRLTVTSHNPARASGGQRPAPRPPPALHPIASRRSTLPPTYPLPSFQLSLKLCPHALIPRPRYPGVLGTESRYV